MNSYANDFSVLKDEQNNSLQPDNESVLRDDKDFLDLLFKAR